MAGPLFSDSWYRVAGLTPKLRTHTQINRHRYRGRIWYVLQDLSTDRVHRFSPAANLIIGLMDGRRTVQNIWESAATRLGDDVPTQDEMIQLLGQLHNADVLQSDVSPLTTELLERHDVQQRRTWQSSLMSPLSLRVPLFDPDRVLQRFLRPARLLFSWPGFVVWLAFVIPGVVLAATNADVLMESVLDRLFSAQGIILLWFLFPVLKLLHEFGHAFAAKSFGGEVHEMGIMFLVLSPIPYVDASSSAAFRSKGQRIVVGAGGIMVETFVAAIALMVWTSAEPGIVRTFAYQTILIAGISTLLFNANPLIRFDGYYIFSDLIEIPNLRGRSNAYFGYLFEHYLFGRKDAEIPDSTPGERAWFLSYAVAAFLYRILIVSGILLMIGGRFFGLGLLLGGFVCITWICLPIGKGAKYLLKSPRIQRVRFRAITVTLIIAAAIVGAVTWAPVPLRTRAEGVVRIPEESYVRAGVEGFIHRIVAKPNARVRRGDVLIISRDSALAAEIRVLEARLRALDARHDEQIMTDRVRAEIVREEQRYVRENIARAREKAGRLIIRSAVDGVFVAPNAPDLPGRFVQRGELLALVIDLNSITVNSVVSQEEIDLVRNRNFGVEVRLVENVSASIPAAVKRIVPGAIQSLPSSVLGTAGGGRVAVDPSDPQGLRTIQKMFQVDLGLKVRHPVLNAGGRVHIRFDHGTEPLVHRWYRLLRNLFLSRFNV